MPTEEEIYRNHSEQYERLVAREDQYGHILRTLEQIQPLKGKDVIELGAGTGRLTKILAPLVKTISAYDISEHMLARAEASLRSLGLTNWETATADHRDVPATDESADLVIAGWSFCYLAVWGGKNWWRDLEAGYREIERLLRPGGTVILLETLGTGGETPNPPRHLEGYFSWLAEKGFQNTWIRTDYRFISPEEAVELVTFFFGEKLGRKMRRKDQVFLPECTGVWWKKK